jgi:crossover junction endodeoxyribonuclease RusA
MFCTFFMPWPPTLNTMWRTTVIKGRQRTLLSEKGRAYRDEVIAQSMIWRQGATLIRYPLPTPCSILFVGYPPNRAERDADNHMKAPLDALVHAGVLRGDSNRHVVDLRFKWEAPTKKPFLHVTITW